MADFIAYGNDLQICTSDYSEADSYFCETYETINLSDLKTVVFFTIIFYPLSHFRNKKKTFFLNKFGIFFKYIWK